MVPMPIRATRTAALVAVLLIVLLIVAACGSTAPSARPTASAATSVPPSTPAATDSPTDAPTDAPATAGLTPVPGGESEEPEPPVDSTGTTETEWGTILDAVPDDFPIYPGAEPAELPEAASGIWSALAPAEAVSAWYGRTLEGQGYSVDLGSALEDGSRVAEIQTDLPECRIQVTFRPAAGSTMIVVMYGAGCRPGGA